MKDIYADILGQKAAEVLQRICKMPEVKVEKSFAGSFDRRPELAMAIDFKGRTSAGDEIEGLMLCGYESRAEASAFISAMAEGCGLEAAKAESRALEIIGEYLNIVIGLAAAAMAERGLEIEFAPPRPAEADKRPSLEFKEVLTIALSTEAWAPPTVWAIFPA